jgi:hypothetical protein
MSDTSFRQLALPGHQLPPLCGPDNLTRSLAKAKPIRQTRPRLDDLHLPPAHKRLPRPGPRLPSPRLARKPSRPPTS